MKCTPAAQAALVEKFMPLLTSIAGKQWHRGLGFRLGSFDDCLGEAMIGFLRAVKNFDPSRGVKFITYAFRCTNNYLLRACCKGGLIAVPEDIGPAWRRYGRTPELCAAAQAAMKTRPVEAFTGTSERSYPPDEPDGMQFEDRIRCLPAKYRELLRLRYVDGLFLDQIGKLWGCSGSAVQQMEERALARIALQMAKAA